MEVQKGRIQNGDNVLIVDDVLVTGGTAAAACELVSRCGGRVAEVSLLIELSLHGGRKKAPEGVQYCSLVTY
jgi:adenine phosphoribosyltransferase